MKKVKNLPTSLKGDKEKEVLSYLDLIKIMTEASVPQGISVEEMRQRINILNKLDGKTVDPEVEIEFSDDEIKLIRALCKNMRWAVINEDIIKFNDYIEAN